MYNRAIIESAFGKASSRSVSNSNFRVVNRESVINSIDSKYRNRTLTFADEEMIISQILRQMRNGSVAVPKMKGIKGYWKQQ